MLAACKEEAVQQEEVVRPVRAIRMADGTAFSQRSFSGRARAAQEVSLSFRVSGTILSVNVDVGDEVAEGDVVSMLDPDTFRSEVNRLEANLASANAALRAAVNQAERDQTLFEQGNVAEARLDESIAARDGAQAEVASTDAALERARLDLNYTQLKAPFSGVVVATFAEDFEEIRAQEPVLRLLDHSKIEMVVDIPEHLISFAGGVTNIEVVFDAFPDVIVAAEISEIGSEASQTTRTYPVTLVMDQPDGVMVLPGMAGSATGQPPESFLESQGQMIPIAAVFSPEGGDASYVWIVDEASGSVVQREVSVGDATDLGVAIHSGVEAGEVIVTAGVHRLREGQVVRVDLQ